MADIFNTIQMPQVNSNVFDLTHDVKMSCNMGKLYPILAVDCIPGDKFHIEAESLIRLSPLVSPVMHRIDVTMHFFFVPNRLVWDNWETWITGNNILGVEPVYPKVQIDNTVHGTKSLADYLGLPDIQPVNQQDVSAIPFAAYQCIYNEYYRDQNLILPVDYKLVDGDNSGNPILQELRTRAWEHDYFTSALPFAQKGPAVDMPVGDVFLKDDWDLNPKFPVFRRTNDVVPAFDIQPGGVTGSFGQAQLIPTTDGFISGDGNTVAYDPVGSLGVGAGTINDFRSAMRLQEWLEKNARGGTRYIESMLVHFGVRSSDARLNRPEYITGTKSPIVISEVLNTTGEINTTGPSTGGLPQGNMAGHGVGVTSGKAGSYYCEEHGYIIGIMSIMPKTAYFQGVPRHFIKFDRLEYGWPSFAALGEQAVKNQEIYADQPGPSIAQTFGYMPRFTEYRYIPSRVAGDFKDTLDFWTMARKFATPPQLNATFIECVPTRDVFAVTDPNEDTIYCHILNRIKAVRKLPKYGTPSY